MLEKTTKVEIEEDSEKTSIDAKVSTIEGCHQTYQVCLTEFFYASYRCKFIEYSTSVKKERFIFFSDNKVSGTLFRKWG